VSKHGGNWEEEQVPSELALLLVDGWIDLTAWQQEKKTGELPGDGVSGWCVPLVIKAACCQLSCFFFTGKASKLPYHVSRALQTFLDCLSFK
jgi:hypothetical protein